MIFVGGSAASFIRSTRAHSWTVTATAPAISEEFAGSWIISSGWGVDSIWIPPIYPSPMAEFGSNISNYIDIDPIFGTLAEFDALLAYVHARGMKLLLDY